MFSYAIINARLLHTFQTMFVFARQSLKLDNWEVVLNTNLCRVESRDGEYRGDDQEVNEILGSDRILASWTCLCRLGKNHVGRPEVKRFPGNKY